jgi:hypothetical protein
MNADEAQMNADKAMQVFRADFSRRVHVRETTRPRGSSAFICASSAFICVSRIFPRISHGQ